MNEPIQQSVEEVSIVIYDSPLPPRYLRFSKKFITTLFVVFPVAIGLIFLSLIIFALLSRIKNSPTPKIPDVLTSEQSKIFELESEIKILNESNKVLQEKLSVEDSGSPTEETPFLVGLKRPYGMQNLISQNKISLDLVEFIPSDNKVNLKFQIISQNSNTKVSGHVLVLLISENGLKAYPPEANLALSSGITFNMGEPFSVSRLRPTVAEFFQTPLNGTARFIIYIFSREGDLLLMKEAGPYKIGSI